MELVLSLDIGTGTARAALFDLAGRLAGPIGSVAYSTPEAAPNPEWAEVEAHVWLEAACDAICQAVEGADATRVHAIGISGLFPALVLLDPRGSVIRPAILYSDRRSTRQLARLAEQGLAQAMGELSGSAITTGTTSATSLLWCREEEPAAFARAERIVHVNGLVGLWLTGEVGMDRSNAALTGLFDARQRCWSASLCASLGLDPTLLPPVVEGCAPVGVLRPEAAQELSLPAGIPVAMGGGDTVCAALGSGCTGPGDFVISSGTTDTLALCVDRYVYDPALYCVGHVVPDRFLSIAPMSCTGGCLEWYARHFAGAERAEAESLGVSVYDVLEQEAAVAPPGAGGVLFLPYLKGERTPVNDPSARGVLFGLTDTTGRPAATRAVLEGVAFGIRHCLEAMERAHGLRVEQLTVVGKPGRSGLWSQIKADVTGRPVVALSFEERSLLGAAALGALAAGLAPTDRDPAGRVRGAMELIATHGASQRTFEPRPHTRDLYDDMFTLYIDLYKALHSSGLFVRAAGLPHAPP